MSDAYIIVAILLLAFFSSAALTRLVRKEAVKRSLLDMPSSRGAHQIPVPRVGGIAIVSTFFVFCSVLLLTRHLPLTSFLLLCLALPVAFAGLLDDLYTLHPRWRMLAQGVCALILALWLGALPEISFGPWSLHLSWISVPLIMLALIWMSNLYNFMDGIDGLAASECCFVVVAAAFLSVSSGADSVLWLLYLGLAAAAGGFLVSNWAPASVFMGDVGSTFLGFMLGLLALLSLYQGELTVWVWFILLSVFIADTACTLLVRVARGERWYEAHNTHAYQHASRRFGRHDSVALIVLLINVFWLFPLAFLANRYPQHGLYAALSGIVPLLLASYAFGGGRPALSQDTGQ